MIKTCDRKRDFPRKFAAGIVRRPRVAWCGPVHKGIIRIYTWDSRPQLSTGWRFGICNLNDFFAERSMLPLRWIPGPQFRCYVVLETWDRVIRDQRGRDWTQAIPSLNLWLKLPFQTDRSVLSGFFLDDVDPIVTCSFRIAKQPSSSRMTPIWCWLGSRERWFGLGYHIL